MFIHCTLLHYIIECTVLNHIITAFGHRTWLARPLQKGRLIDPLEVQIELDLFLDAEVRQSVADTLRFPLCRCLWTLTSRSVGRPWDVICFLKAMTNSLEILILCIINFSWGRGCWWNKMLERSKSRKKLVVVGNENTFPCLYTVHHLMANVCVS